MMLCRHIRHAYEDEAGVVMKIVDIDETNMLIDDARNKGATEISYDATESGRPLYKTCGFKDSGECMFLVRK